MVEQPGEVLAEEAGQEGEGKEQRGDDGQLLHHHVQAIGHRRDVGVHGAGQQVTVGVDQVADADEMVVEITKVAFVLRRHPRQPSRTRQKAGEHVALRRDDLAQRHQRAVVVDLRNSGVDERRPRRRGMVELRPQLDG